MVYIKPDEITTGEAAREVAEWYRSEARKYRFGQYQNVTEAAFPLEHAATAIENLSIYLVGGTARNGVRGTFSCPICGKDTPHTHSQAEIEASGD